MSLNLIKAALLLSVLSACSLPAEPLLTAAGQAPTAMSAVPGGGAVQMETLPPAAAPTKSIGTPVPGWEQIPIMPGAYDGELNDLVYLYSVNVPVKEAEEYYLVKMDVNGWDLLDRQTMQIGGSAEPATIFDFEKNGEPLNIMLVHLAAEDATAVILTRISR